MLSKDKEVFNSNTILLPIQITLFNQCQNLNLIQSQLEMFFIRFNNFYCNMVLDFMVKGFDNLSKTTSSQSFNELIPEPDVILVLPNVVAIFVVSSRIFVLIFANVEYFLLSC